jgi:hypothetical protein
MLSPALVALNRDAFIIGEPAETTVDLDRHRAASDLDEIRPRRRARRRGGLAA